MNIRHAWYSRKSANIYGSVIYTRADGTEVEVTAVNEDINYNYNWPDKEYRGEVVKFLRPTVFKLNFSTVSEKETETY